MNKQPKAWVESLLVAYVDNQLGPDQMAAVEATIRDDPEAQAIVGVLRRSAAAVKSAYDQPLNEPVPERLLAAIGVANPSTGANVVPLRRPTRLLPSRQTLMALAASIATLAIGFAAGYMQSGRGGDITPATGGTSEQFEAALYRALEQDQPGAKLSYQDMASGATETVTVVRAVTTGVSNDCREFRHDSAGVAGATVSRGLACRSSSGDWSVLTLPAEPAT